MKKLKLLFFTFLFVLAVGVSGASATYMADITYDYANNGSGNYTFTFNVFNISDGTSTGNLDYFQINFDADNTWDLYSNLTWFDKKGWTSTAVEPTPGFGGLPGAVTADDSIFGSGGGGISMGGHIDGFKVSFNYTGSLSPVDQLFSFNAQFGTNLTQGIPQGNDPNNPEYFILGSDDGTTRYVPVQHGVPEPAGIVMLLMGLLGLYGFRRSQR